MKNIHESVHATFLKLEKVSEWVDRDGLWNVLKMYGMEKMLEAVSSEKEEYVLKYMVDWKSD